MFTRNQLLEDSNPDIACLSETWITNDKSHFIINHLHPNFHISVKTREDRTEGGVMILVKKTYASKVEILDLPTPSFPFWFKEERKKQFIEVLIVKINPKR